MVTSGRIRDFIHVADLASGHLSALRHLRQGDHGQSWYGNGSSVLEVVRILRR
ncbi:NAD-dependent epimerase/dehydratase family protein [Bradyrhizobium sp. RDM4]|uniref:NAD-dependent epimerase/dehydratase family protein n=1 Tax=Bradyrhizobium sp. RDM4 TaxID=3378765 RepID=UPI0038FCD727